MPRRLLLLGATLGGAIATSLVVSGSWSSTVVGVVASSPGVNERQEFLEAGTLAPTQQIRSRATRTDPPTEPVAATGWVARARDEVLSLWRRPGTRLPDSRIDARNPWEQLIAFPITAVRARAGESWYQIKLGIEPNGSSGWVRSADVEVARIRHRITVDLSARTLTHFKSGQRRHRFSVGIGKPETPTTIGRFFVWAHLDPQDPAGPYGSYLLGLSGFSRVLTYWPGGGRMAIHGTADQTDAGRAVSNGCPRVPNAQMNKLQDVPMGTPVVIRQ